MKTKLDQAVNSDGYDADERAALAEAIRRNEDLSSGKVTACTHEEVMRAAARALSLNSTE
jgi:hypothetical protein